MNYEAVIGLEVHVQVRTQSKMFSRAAARYGEPENSLTDPVVLALPGALPVMNRRALDLAVKAGLMLGCRIAPLCKWDRKNYFYPDSPKNYQISQYDMPICLAGSLEIELPGPARNIMGEHKRIALTRIHLEEDVGKLTHAAGGSLIDYNRAGTPLMEIVSEPDLRSADEAFAYLTALKSVMVYGGISDCDMEKGQMRCDANVSIRPEGARELGTKVELKNLNSISFVRAGISHEIRRQTAIVERGGSIVQETRDYDGQAGTSQSLRSKEMAHDYRYFPDPDLMPVRVDDAWKARIQQECPELPFDKQRRFFEQHRLPYSITSVLVPERELAGYFERVVAAGADPQAAGNWISNHLLRELGARGRPPAEAETLISAERAAGLVKAIASGAIPSTAVAGASAAMFAGTQAAEAVMADYRAATAGEIEEWCRAAIAGNAKALAEFKGGKDGAINAFKGPVMRAAKARENPKISVDARAMDETLRRLLA